LTFSSRAFSALITTKAAAPSLIVDELPASVPAQEEPAIPSVPVQ
jgi:hypothetical protein